MMRICNACLPVLCEQTCPQQPATPTLHDALAHARRLRSPPALSRASEVSDSAVMHSQRACRYVRSRLHCEAP